MFLFLDSLKRFISSIISNTKDRVLPIFQNREESLIYLLTREA